MATTRGDENGSGGLGSGVTGSGVTGTGVTGTGQLTVGDLAAAMGSIAPLEGAEPWDKVGIHVGDASMDIGSGPVVLTIDLTERVMDEAEAAGARAVIAYHPPIWEPLDRLAGRTPTERIVRRAVERGIAIYSPHTALDAAEGGITDWLAEGIAGVTENGRPAADVRAIVPAAREEKSRGLKVVTFLPAEHVDTVRNALATAGAGRIGGYEVCSFSADGVGTFLGGESTNPVMGEAGRLEHTQEKRLEMVCSRGALALAIETLRQFHPYEEPAIDVYELVPEPKRATGAGRRVHLDQPASGRDIARRLHRFLGTDRVKMGVPAGLEDAAIERVGVVPGAGASLLKHAQAAGCELFVTGELKHHEVLAAMAAGMGVVLAGHSNTERGYLVRLAQRLKAALPSVNVQLSSADRDPLALIGDG